MKYQTKIARIEGGICGNLWWPQVMAGRSFCEDLRARFNRFSDPSGATFRDALLSMLNENGGDFQGAEFTADTELVIVRCAVGPAPGKPASVRTFTREYRKPVSELRDCSDLVNADFNSFDFGGCDE